ncbi:hypothetical protein BRADI_2g01400v3 [Brachypodium distachyon]|uniref:KIB1-4 beta-propeller domain-containing protein n=1 Tax=Brachypodium distachyon TaxID=15368 RepID=I1HBF4_BRADI|nr:hypothetical protein BRADI_2g01400v3 [Brachypodium distachyon]
MEEQESPAMPAPWVILPRVKACSDSFTVLSAPTMNSFQWTPPGGAPARCVGSNAGWLALVTYVPGQHVIISLANPVTGARIELPPLPLLRLVPKPEDLELMLDIAVRKVAFAPVAVIRPPCRGVVHLCRGYHLAFSGDGALHVVWSASEGEGAARGPHCPEMLVMRYDEASASWAAAASVGGDRAFLIGDRNQTMSVPADGESSAWLRPDSVYFTNIPLCNLKAIGIVGRRGLWALDVRTGHVAWPRAESDTTERRLESELDVLWDKSLWLMPCLS